MVRTRWCDRHIRYNTKRGRSGFDGDFGDEYRDNDRSIQAAYSSFGDACGVDSSVILGFSNTEMHTYGVGWLSYL